MKKQKTQTIIDHIRVKFKRPKFSSQVLQLKLSGTNTFIFDFDSFLWEESLDAMLNRSIKNLPDKTARNQRINNIMDAGMEGRITMHESLKQRFETASVTPEILQNYIQDSFQKMNPQMAEFIEFLQSKNQKIFVFSGGFKDFIAPFMEAYGIPADNIYANDLVLQDDGSYTFNPKNLMATSDGKTTLFAQLKKNRVFVGQTFSFGDSRRDVSIGADHGFGYGGIRRRLSVEKNSANYFYKPSQILEVFKKAFNKL
jgi:D-3-phosphoglycerate dehydrogenase